MGSCATQRCTLIVQSRSLCNTPMKDQALHGVLVQQQVVTRGLVQRPRAATCGERRPRAMPSCNTGALVQRHCAKLGLVRHHRAMLRFRVPRATLRCKMHACAKASCNGLASWRGFVQHRALCNAPCAMVRWCRRPRATLQGIRAKASCSSRLWDLPRAKALCNGLCNTTEEVELLCKALVQQREAHVMQLQGVDPCATGCASARAGSSCNGLLHQPLCKRWALVQQTRATSLCKR